MSDQSFENARLRKLANFSCAIPLLWIGVLYAVPTLGTGLNWYFFRGMIFIIWAVLLTHAIYYGHLLMTRFQMSLLGFMIFILIWGNAAAISWVSFGWEAGITILLGSTAWVAWSLTWSHSVTALLGVTRLTGKGGLILLGLATPAAAVIVFVSVVWVSVWLGKSSVPPMLLALNLSCVTLLAAAGILSFKARRAARRLVETSAPISSCPVSST